MFIVQNLTIVSNDSKEKNSVPISYQKSNLTKDKMIQYIIDFIEKNNLKEKKTQSIL